MNRSKQEYSLFEDAPATKALLAIFPKPGEVTPKSTATVFDDSAFKRRRETAIGIEIFDASLTADREDRLANTFSKNYTKLGHTY